MKKLLLLLFVVSVGYLMAATVHNLTITPAATSVSASSTNTTAGTAADIPGGCGTVTLYASATGSAATGTGDFIVKFAISYDGTTWTYGPDSAIKLTFSNIGNTNKTISDWFVVEGAKQIRVAQMENTYTGAVSGLSFKLTAIGQ